jgi:hypothetical protein
MPENPEYNNIDSEFSKLCMAMQKERLAGENREKYYKKENVVCRE